MKKTLASLLIGISSVLGNTETTSRPSNEESIVTTRPGLEETIFDIEGVVKKDIKVREAKVEFKMPEIHNIPILGIDIPVNGIELFNDDDYTKAINEMNKDGGKFYFDKKSKKVFSIDESDKQNGQGSVKVVKQSRGRVLSIISEGERKRYALYDLTKREGIESVLPIDIRNDVGLIGDNVLFKLSNGTVIYKASDKVVGFNRKFVVIKNEDGYFLVDVGLKVNKKVWEKDEREDVYVSDNGRYCLGVLKEEGRFIDICDVLKGERKYKLIGNLGIESLNNKGDVKLNDGQVVKFSDMNDYE